MAGLTVIVIGIDPYSPSESVTRTERLYVPAARVDDTVTTCVNGSIEIPLGADGMLNTRPDIPGVPPLALNAVDNSERPAVVVMLLPPETVTRGLTRIEYDANAVAPAESVTTIVFEYIPAATPPLTVMTPVLELIAIPESLLANEKLKVPVPPAALIDGPVNA